MLIVLIALALQGCSATQEQQTMVGEQASEQMQSLVRDTMKTASGEWKSTSNGPAADPCTLPNGSEGVWFSWNQIAAGSSDPEAVMHRVDQAWQDAGLATRTQSVKRADGETLRRVGSAGREVSSIQFNATTDGMSINVQSLCSRGHVSDFPPR